MSMTLRSRFMMPAAAIATALLPMTGAPAFADEGSHTATASTASVATTTDMEAVRARNAIIEQAAQHALDNPGEVGVSILMGSDTGPMTGAFFAENLQNGFHGQFGLDAVSFIGENAPGEATEFTYSYAYKTNTGKLDVMTRGPYNADNALSMATTIATAVQSETMLRGVSYSPDGMD